MNVLPSQFALLKRSLDLAAQNHRVVSNNIANVNTPGFQAQELRFEDELEALARGGPARVEVHPTGDPMVRDDGNNVDIDREIGKLNNTALQFRAYTELLQIRLSEMRNAMKLN